MHILLIPSWYPEPDKPYLGSFFQEQAQALARSGDAVGVLFIRTFPIYEYRGFLNHPSGLRGSDEGGVSVIRGKALLPVPKAHRLNLRAVENVLRKAYAEYKATWGVPDVIHAHSMFPAGVIASRIARSEGIPLVITEHRPSFAERARTGVEGKLARSSANEASCLVAVSPGFAEILNNAYQRSDWRAEPGLLAPDFERARIIKRPNKPVIFGHVSHLDPGKRVDLLIDSFAEAFGEDPTVRLRIIGGSSELEDLKALVKERGLTNVDFTGPVSRTQIVNEFSKMHVFVLPSDAESFGTVLWEALALGIPLISTETWGGKWAVTPKTGILLPIGDGKALAAALREMRTRHQSYSSAELRELSQSVCGEVSFVRRMHEMYFEAIELSDV